MRLPLLTMLLGGVVTAAVTVRGAEPTVDELIGALKTSDQAARLMAIDYLGMKGERAGEAVPALTDLLKDDTAAVRAHAAEALGKIGKAALPAVPPLVRCISDADPLVRRKALMALHGIPARPNVVVPLLTKMMEDADPAMRHRALSALAEGGAEVVPGLVKALRHEKAAYWACLVLREIGPAAKDAVPALEGLLSDQRPGVRREAILALAAIGEPSAVPQIAARLDDEFDRTAATFALGRLGNIPPAVEAKIQANIKSSDQGLAVASVWALAKTHPDDQQLVRQAVATIVDGLKSTDPHVRMLSARGLASLEAKPELTMSVLHEKLCHADDAVVMGALKALAGMGGKAVPTLIETLKLEKARPGVVYVLGEIGPDAAPAVDALRKLIDDKDEQVRREVAIALGKIGPAAKAAVPELIGSLNHSEGPVAYGAAFALGGIGPAAADAEPALWKALNGKDESLALISARALSQIHPACAQCAAKAVPLLVRSLSDPAPKYRAEAAQGLKAFGPLAKAAVPALNKALADEDADVRQQAAAALKAVGG